MDNPFPEGSMSAKFWELREAWFTFVIATLEALGKALDELLERFDG